MFLLSTVLANAGFEPGVAVQHPSAKSTSPLPHRQTDPLMKRVKLLVWQIGLGKKVLSGERDFSRKGDQLVET